MKKTGFFAIFFSLLPLLASAGTITRIDVSPDITIDVGSEVIADEDVLSEGMAVLLGNLPGNADLTAFHRLENGDALFALDTTVLLPGNQLSRPGDVIRHDGTDYTLEFDGQTNGVLAGAGIDAITLGIADKLILSFDVTTELDGFVIADEDLVQFDGSSFTPAFDASSHGIDGSLDLDAAHFDPANGRLLVSFNTAGSVSGVPFADEDLVMFDQLASSWTLAFDGSAADPAWLAADLDAAFAVLMGGDVIFFGGFESLINRGQD